jgi:hypothetical protein
LILLDDLAHRDPTDGFLDFMYTLINYRCTRPHLITLYTTNLDSKALANSVGPRIVSRLSGCLRIEMFGEDLRKAK